MALTKDIIKLNSVLSGLSDDQVAAIVTLSTNDEATQIGSRIGELHGRYDADVLAVVGVPKNQGEKSYDYVKRVLGEFKTKIASLATSEADIKKLKDEKAELEGKLKDNAGDAVIKQKLQDAEQKLGQLQSLYDDDKKKFDTEKTELTSSLQRFKIENEFDKGLSSLKFKSAIPESVREVLINDAKAKIFNTTKPEFVEVNGKSVLVFRDANGQVLNNQENKLNPFTATELLKSTLKDALDFGKKQPGAGSGPGDDTEVSLVDISSARTQIEADEIIQKHLLSSGFVKTNPDFSTEQQKLRAEHNVSKLPMR